MNFFKLTKIITLSLLIITFSFIVTGCQSQNDVRDDILLDNLISKNDSGFVFEQMTWLKTKNELIEENHIPVNGVTDDGNGFLILNDDVSFKEPKLDATVKYLFHEDTFVGGNYIIQAESQDELVQVAAALYDHFSKTLGKPEGNTLDDIFSEEAIRDGSKQSMVQYISDDHTTLTIDIFQSKRGEDPLFLIDIKTRYADGPLPDTLL